MFFNGKIINFTAFSSFLALGLSHIPNIALAMDVNMERGHFPMRSVKDLVQTLEQPGGPINAQSSGGASRPQPLPRHGRTRVSQMLKIFGEEASPTMKKSAAGRYPFAEGRETAAPPPSSPTSVPHSETRYTASFGDDEEEADAWGDGIDTSVGDESSDTSPLASPPVSSPWAVKAWTPSPRRSQSPASSLPAQDTNSNQSPPDRKEESRRILDAISQAMAKRGFRLAPQADRSPTEARSPLAESPMQERRETLAALLRQRGPRPHYTDETSLPVASPPSSTEQTSTPLHPGVLSGEKDFYWRDYLEINPGLANLFPRKGNIERIESAPTEEAKDLIRANILWEHYSRWGRGSLFYKRARPVDLPGDFDSEIYLELNPTLSSVFDEERNRRRIQGAPTEEARKRIRAEALEDHYLESGGRLAYIRSLTPPPAYDDVVGVHGILSITYREQLVSLGFDDWTPEGYLRCNSSLSNMFGRPKFEGWTEADILANHFLKWGREAGRVYM